MKKDDSTKAEKTTRADDEKVLNGTMSDDAVVEYIYSQPDPKLYDWLNLRRRLG